jgi:multidrug resistance efflux pump
MHERTVDTARSQDEAFRAYVRKAASSLADDLAKLADLKDRGMISPEEFERAKAKALETG